MKIPKAGSFFRYWRTWMADFMCGCRGDYRNWLRCWTENAMSGLVCVRKLSLLPINMRYRVGSCNNSPWSGCSLTVRSKGHVTVLSEGQSNSCNNSLVNFLWVSNKPQSVCRTSIPRKKWTYPRSLILKVLLRNTLREEISASLLPVSKISSMYTAKNTTDSPVLLQKRE